MDHIIKTKLSYTVDLPTNNIEGFLSYGETGSLIDFTIKRFYFIYKINKGIIRGNHAHKQTVQMFFCIQGCMKMILDNGTETEEIIMEKPNRGIFLDKMIWHNMTEFSDNALLLVVASEPYDPSDYIRDYAEFLKLRSKKIHGYNSIIRNDIISKSEII